MFLLPEPRALRASRDLEWSGPLFFDHFFESIFAWFFHDFYLHFGMIFGRLFIEFTFLFRAIFLEDVLIDFSLFLHSFFFGEPSPTRVLLNKYYGSRTCTFFEKHDFSCEAIPQITKMQVCFRIVLSLKFLIFSASISVSICSSDFNRKLLPKSTKTC